MFAFVALLKAISPFAVFVADVPEIQEYCGPAGVPVGPFGPALPVGPVLPAGPCGPALPVAACGPALPCGP